MHKTKDNKYTFIEKKDSKGGILSAKLAGVSFALLIIDAILSFAFQGSAGAIAGVIALAAMALSVYGFLIGMKSFSEKECSPKFSVIGSISSGVVMVGWLTIFLTGL
ncbi:MAG: DUF6142 family protein [Eubacteriales bacterium]|jgi:hypothetical protein